MRRSSKFTLSVLLGAAFLAGCGQAESPPAADAAPAAPAPESPATAPATPGHAAGFRIGELSAFALRDGELTFPNDNTIFGVNRTSEEVAALLSAAGLPTGELRLSLQPLLVNAGGRVLLFDTGAGRNMGAEAGHLADALAAAGVDPDSVTDVFLSHLHGDHVGGLVNVAGTPNFPNAAIHISAAEWRTLSGLTPEEAATFGIVQFPALITAMTSKVRPFQPGAELVPGLVRAVDVQGHTPGHSAFLVGTGEQNLLYIGDAMHHSVISVQKPEWALAFDGDADRAARSRAQLLQQSAGSGQRIYAVHFPFPGLGRITAGESGGFRWTAE